MELKSPAQNVQVHFITIVVELLLSQMYEDQ